MDKPDHQFKRFGLPGDHALQKQARARRHGHLDMVRAIREGNRSKPYESETMGRVALSIPELDYYIILERFPDLKSPDAEIRHKAWLKFLKHPASEIYRVHRKW